MVSRSGTVRGARTYPEKHSSIPTQTGATVSVAPSERHRSAAERPEAGPIGVPTVPTVSLPTVSLMVRRRGDASRPGRCEGSPAPVVVISVPSQSPATGVAWTVARLRYRGTSEIQNVSRGEDVMGEFVGALMMMTMVAALGAAIAGADVASVGHHLRAGGGRHSRHRSPSHHRLLRLLRPGPGHHKKTSLITAAVSLYRKAFRHDRPGSRRGSHGSRRLASWRDPRGWMSRRLTEHLSRVRQAKDRLIVGPESGRHRCGGWRATFTRAALVDGRRSDLPGVAAPGAGNPRWAAADRCRPSPPR